VALVHLVGLLIQLDDDVTGLLSGLLVAVTVEVKSEILKFCYYLCFTLGGRSAILNVNSCTKNMKHDYISYYLHQPIRCRPLNTAACL
jgi:hypothetical protein